MFFVLCFSLFTGAYALEAKRSLLENGMTLMVVEKHNLPVVKVVVGIKAGSIYEPEGKSGVANLAASLLTEGTFKRTARQISSEIEFVGGSVGASAGEDYITVSLSVLKKDVELGFDILSDIILNPSFPEDELKKKAEIIKADIISSEDDPSYVAQREFNKAVFGEHPYGRLLSGTVETIEKISRDDLVGFHSGYYTAGNAIMSVVGDLSSQEAEELIKKYFSNWRAGSVTTVSAQKIPVQKKRNTVTVDKDLTQATISLGHLGVSREDPDYYSLTVMNYILGGGGFASRLMDNIREDKGLVYDVHSYFNPRKYGGSFEVSLQTKNESANKAIEEVLEEIRKIRSERVSDAELTGAQLFLTGSFPMKIETSSRIANFLIAVEFYRLGADYIDKYPTYINSVTKEDVLRVAKKYLDPDNYTIIVVANQKEAGIREEYSK
ncbi:MAG: insulinase family protein [Nitrospirae bacterium]|nr:insulinase family protein [Nitrospirota bacterium]